MNLPPPSTRAVVSAGLCPAGIGTARISRSPMSCISPPRFASTVSLCVLAQRCNLASRRFGGTRSLIVLPLQGPPLRSPPSLSREDLPCAVSCCFALSRWSRSPPSRATRSQTPPQLLPPPPPPPALRRRTSQAPGTGRP